MSAADTGDTRTSMQSLPRLQQPWSSRRILTLPEQEQRWHPMPPAPKTSSRNTASDTMICDINFIELITSSIPNYCTAGMLNNPKR